MDVEPGLIAIVIWMAVVILWWSGWRKELSAGLPEWGLTLFLVLWPFAYSRTVALAGIGEINLGAALILASALTVLSGMQTIRRWTALAAGLLIASVALFTNKLTLMIPALLVSNPHWILAVMIGALTVMLLRNPVEQWIALTFGFTLSAVAEAWLRAEPRGWIVLGDSEWMAVWWLAIGSSRCLSSLAARMAKAWGKLGLRKGGQRS
ncbi:hypothetical protein [Cohnella sp. AR92]|uniref:hypothetical protein n=1 Tax=Cohnella sp. AR92 TaxID=648716 RepID=UPI000F8D013F|nr:hypothetical protein [Cohnella sp. AR92]RUS48154.1 hypothetical protein ELR57_06375 [Cohnella sp. AR92]